MILCSCQIIENVFCYGSFGRFAIKLSDTSHFPIFRYFVVVVIFIFINYNKVNKKIVYTEIPIPRCRYCS